MPTTEEKILTKLEEIALTLNLIRLHSRDTNVLLKELLQHFSPPQNRPSSPGPSQSPTQKDE